MSERSLNRRQLVGGASAAAVAAGVVKLSPAFAQDATPPAELHPEASPVSANDFPTVPPELEVETNWAVEGGNLKQTRVAQGSSISAATVANLELAWKYDVSIAATYGAFVAYPAIVDGVIYQQTGLSDVIALDLATGEVKWQNTYSLPVPSGGPNGVAVAYGNVYYPVGNAGVYCVSAETGEVIWQTDITGPRGEGITTAPAVYGGLLYISTVPGSVDGFYQGGQRGVLHTLDAATGATVWVFDTVVDNLWGNSMVNSGGGIWHPPAFDEAGSPYYSIANASPYPGTEEFPSGSSRPGPNDYANNVIKIDPATAGLIWNTNVNPHDIYDLDNQLSPVLASVTDSYGFEHDLVITSGKHGYVIAVEPQTGEIVWQTPVGRHQNDKLDVIPEGETIEVYPGTLGGVETPLAVVDGVVIAPVLNSPSYYTPTGMDLSKLDFLAGNGEFVALNLLDGSVIWDIAIPTGNYGAATVANDVVFGGGLDGVIRALNITSGEQVWSYQTSAGLVAPFAISGDYLVVPSGGLFAPSEDTVDPAPAYQASLHVFKLGA